jgi:ATP-dependent Clp protease ATP-binding subunit ClpC
LKDPEQPIGSFIFTGYTGTGKTYAAKILAEELVGSQHGIVIVDCSEYSADHEYSKLIGAPSGYIGHENGGYLTNAVKKNPFSVILFDEVEKASERVHQLLLQIMDEARLTDGRGQKVSFRDTIVIMTSNLGVKEVQSVSKTIGFGNASKLTKEKRVNAVKEALKKKFRPEFLNRVSCIVNFDMLTKKDYMRIIKLELEKLKRNLKLNRTEYSKLDVTFDKTLYNHIYTTGIDEKFGARPLKRAIEKEVSTPLAKKLLKDNVDCSNTKVTVSAQKGEVVIDVVYSAKVDAPPFYMEAGSED